MNYGHLRRMNIPAVIQVFESVRGLPSWWVVAKEIIAHLNIVKEEDYADFKVHHDPSLYEYNIFLLYYDQIVRDNKLIRRWAAQLYKWDDIRYKEFRIFHVIRGSLRGRVREEIVYRTKVGGKPFVDALEMSKLLVMGRLTRRALQEGSYLFLEKDRWHAETLDRCLRQISRSSSTALHNLRVNVDTASNMSADQMRGIDLINLGSVSAVTGSAGTGKTTVITQIWNDFVARNMLDRLFVLSPTNMAAENVRARLGSVKGGSERITTIHRIISEVRKRKRVFPSNSLIIFDESSMLDNILVEFMQLDEHNQNNNKYLFCGDDAQLRPVARDSLFRIVLGILPQRTVRLETNFRSSDLIIQNANLILNCNDFYLMEGPNYVIDTASHFKNIVWDDYMEDDAMHSLMFITYRNDDLMTINHAVRHLFMREVFEEDELDRVRELTAFSRRYPIFKDGKILSHWEWYIGDRARCWKNVPDMISNGAICWVRGFSKNKIVVEYKGKQILLEARDLWPAYCITVHGAQGTEWPTICFCDFSSGEPLDRELFYVGATRPKQKMVILRTGIDEEQKTRFQIKQESDLLEIFVQEY